jgi:hypothetical protein
MAFVFALLIVRREELWKDHILLCTAPTNTLLPLLLPPLFGSNATAEGSGTLFPNMSSLWTLCESVFAHEICAVGWRKSCGIEERLYQPNSNEVVRRFISFGVGFGCEKPLNPR